MEYGSRVLIISRLAVANLPELCLKCFSEPCFGELGQLKDDSQSYLAQSNPQVSAKLQFIKNKITNMILSCYAEDSRKM